MKYARVTFDAATESGGTKRTSFVGMFSVDGDTVRGERRDSDGHDGTVLNLCTLRVVDVIKVEGQDPKYGTWKKLGGGVESLKET